MGFASKYEDDVDRNPRLLSGEVGAHMPVPTGEHKPKASLAPKPRAVKALSSVRAMKYGWREVHLYEMHIRVPGGGTKCVEEVEELFKTTRQAKAWTEKLAAQLGYPIAYHVGRIGYQNIEGDRISRGQYKGMLSYGGNAGHCPKHGDLLQGRRWCPKCRRRWTSRRLHGKSTDNGERINSSIAALMRRRPHV